MSDSMTDDSSSMQSNKKRKPQHQPNKSVQLIEEPLEQILSGRSTHVYRLSVYRQRLMELKIFMEDEHGVALHEMVGFVYGLYVFFFLILIFNFFLKKKKVSVESQSMNESSDGYTLLTLKLRLKPDRLQLSNVVFELLVQVISFVFV